MRMDGHAATYVRICRMAPYLPKMSYISSGLILNGKFLRGDIEKREESG